MADAGAPFHLGDCQFRAAGGALENTHLRHDCPWMPFHSHRPNSSPNVQP